MKKYIQERVLVVANYIINTKKTIRSAAKEFGVSKSTVHKDVSERLKYIDMDLYKQVRKVLDINISQRHIRGGIATCEKYRKLRNNTIDD